ncbi:MAG: T9SS type A sorting domain-containing protein [Bacteroidota bacterium]|nr:T9SS type A sorting domain-containing protein [Bacteroidota bacterium]
MYFGPTVNNTQVNFLLTPYSCLRPAIADAEVVTHENGYKDSLYHIDPEDPGNLTSAEVLYNSLSLDTRKLNFNDASDKSINLITEFADSLDYNGMTLDAVSKLYFAVQQTDSNGNGIENLKTFFENIILNHSENIELTTKLFYFIQKCKAGSGDYLSAMNGFDQIIDQNPYSYEALIASWDYDAVSLLDSVSGGGGGENNKIVENELSNEVLKSKYLNDDPKEQYDTKVFSKENRKIMREIIFNSFEKLKNERLEKVESLKLKIEKGTADEYEKIEYESRKTLKEIAKPKFPRDINEHITNVNIDINKITDVIKNNDGGKGIISIPTEYNLSQNYPNPFNPITKISFDLPIEGKVNLIVYDLLGREIIKLVNNEFKTSGNYIVEFNGINLTSGIYFYKLESNNFVQTRKMVLIK